METIRTFVLSVCITAISTSVLTMLLPPERSGMRQMMRFAVTAFFLSSLLLSLFSVRELPKLSLPDESADMAKTDLQEETDRQLLTLTEQNLAETLSAALTREGITAENISVEAHITESGGIEINKVVLSLPTAEWERGRAVITGTLGSGVEIIQEE